jgi:predicted nucleic acid-binding protein
VPLIVDASVAAKWLVDEEHGAEAIALFDRDLLIAPDLLPTEVRNALLARVRRGLNSPDKARRAEAAVDSFEVALAPTGTLLGRAFELGLSLAHPIYDCVYLALALERELTLVTADRRLARIAPAHSKPRRPRGASGAACLTRGSRLRERPGASLWPR